MDPSGVSLLGVSLQCVRLRTGWVRSECSGHGAMDKALGPRMERCGPPFAAFLGGGTVKGQPQGQRHLITIQ